MRNWKHKVSESWLAERQKILTASDIKYLLTDYKRIKAHKIKLFDAKQFAKVYGSKKVMNPDGWSYGAAARGHIMEPHAVEEFNNVITPHMYHWDDCIIFSDALKLGYSPDALDIPQKYRFSTMIGDMEQVPEYALEIKSYEAGPHFQKLSEIASSRKTEEVWQIATAMVVCPSIATGYLMFYAPQCNSMCIVDYDSKELENEIEIVEEIADMFGIYRYRMDSELPDLSRKTMQTEDSIYDQYVVDNLLE